MQINVTEDIIAKSARKRDSMAGYDSIRDCMVATALREQTGEEWIAGVRTAMRGGFAYYIPDRIGEKIALFENRKKVEPFSFSLDDLQVINW